MPGTYISPAETELYYLNSRYYNPVIKRFINADGEISDVGGNVLGYNLFAYCFNNPVNMTDGNGNWPKWIDGAINIVSGALQITAGVALGATVGWTGVGAVVAGFLIVNGSAVFAQGIGQIVNDVTDKQILREDNIIRTDVENIGETIGGEIGGEIAGNVYDLAVVAAELYTVSTLSVNLEIGKIKGIRASDGYPGIRYKTKSGPAYSIELHGSHRGHTPHIQINKWVYQYKRYSGLPYRLKSRHFEPLKPWKGIY